MVYENIICLLMPTSYHYVEQSQITSQHFKSKRCSLDLSLHVKCFASSLGLKKRIKSERWPSSNKSLEINAYLFAYIFKPKKYLKIRFFFNNHIEKLRKEIKLRGFEIGLEFRLVWCLFLFGFGISLLADSLRLERSTQAEYYQTWHRTAVRMSSSVEILHAGTIVDILPHHATVPLSVAVESLTAARMVSRCHRNVVLTCR